MNTFKKDSQNEPKPKAHNSVLRLVSIYAALSVIWILLSDKVVESLFADQATAIAASTLKGWGFVAATSLLLYILMRRLTNQILTFAQREQEILRTSKERFRNLFEKNTSVMLLVDPITGEIVDVNASATAYHGYSKAQLTGMRINDLNTLPQEQIAAQMQRASNGESNLFIFTHRLASGEVRDVEVHTSPIEWEGRSLLLGSVHDITERKQAEEKINQLAFYDQLTGLLNRTLLQERLRQAMAASARSGFQSALLLIDLDNLKR